MGARKWWGGSAAAVLIALLTATAASAAILEHYEGDHNYRLDAKIRQSFGLGYNRILKGSRFQVIDSAYLAEGIFNYSWRNEIRFKADLVLQGDAIYRFRRGSHSFGSRGVDTDTGDNQAFLPYGSRTSDAEAFRDDCRNSPDCNFLRDHMIRELSLVFAEKSHGYNITVGKFQRGWGQADGLRLMDILNPLDFRKRFLLRDFDELRIEQWMLDVILFPESYFSMQKLGIINPNLEFIVIPNVRHTEFNINNPYNNEGGGIWAFDLPQHDLSPAPGNTKSGPTPDGVYYNLSRVYAQDSWFDPMDSALAARAAWQMFHGEFTISGYYGWQDLFVTRLKSAELRAGPSGTGAVLLDVDPATAEVAFNAVNDGLITLGEDCNVGGVPVPGGCSVVANIDLDFRERKKLVGVTGTRELGFLQMGPRGVAPVLRVEASYEFNKAFNNNRLVSNDENSVSYHDFLSVMVGEDYFLWLPTSFYQVPWVQKFLFYQPRGIFTSAQVFYFKVFGNGAGARRVLWQAPYPDWKRPANEFWFTFLWFTDLWDDKIHAEGLNVFELQNTSYILRQRFDFKFFGDHFFPRLEFIHIEGKGDQVGGVFDANDMIAVDLLYQF
jgi:hypothetical protein